MEVVTILKNEIEKRFHSKAQLSDIILYLEQEAQDKGKVICKVKVNGLDFSEKDEDRYALTLAQDINEIEIQLQNTKALVQESSQSLRIYMGKLRDSCVEVADSFREGHTLEAQKELGIVVTGTQWLTEALGALKPNLMLLKPTLNLADLWEKAEEQMMKAVQELMEAYERQDFIYMSDVLEYELYSSLELWIEILGRDC